MITSGSLISVRSRIALQCDSGFYILSLSRRWGRLRKIAKRFSAITSLCQAKLGSGAAADLLHSLKRYKKAVPPKDRTAAVLLSFQFNKMSCKIDDNPHRNCKNNNLNYEMNGYIIVNAVA